MSKNIPVIKHPGAVLIVPFLSRDKVVMLRQFRAVIGKYLYELPAGTLEKNESFLSCARRELREETGYSVKRLTKIGYIYPVPGYSTEKIIIYKADGLTAVGRRPESDEIIETGEVSRQRLRRFFKEGRLRDAKTICAFALCGWI